MATDRSPVVEARGLSKRFGDVEALVGLDVEAQSGGVTALLWPTPRRAPGARGPSAARHWLARARCAS
jgi:hypothetical protein